MTKTYCDICGSEIVEYYATGKMQWYKLTNEPNAEETDICNRCMEKFIKYVRGERREE